MRKRYTYIFIFMLAISILLVPREGSPLGMSEYTAYPPFITNAVAPNILLVVDHSGSMQFPAYTGCDWGYYSSYIAQCGSSDTGDDPDYNYNTTRDYYGYFDTSKYYQYVTDTWEENASCSYSAGDDEYKIGSGTTCISGNFLNWASMSRIDVLRKVLTGGKSILTSGGYDTLRSEGGNRIFEDENLECRIEIGGGSYPNFDHEISISDLGSGSATGTCNNLSVWGNGSSWTSRRDKFRFVYQSISGNVDAKLKITSVPTTNSSARAGLIIREGLISRHENVQIMAVNNGTLEFSYRYRYSRNRTILGTVSVSLPVWVRIKRVGYNFTFYYSSDGTNWTEAYNRTVSRLSTNALVGMGVSSYSSNTLGKGDFDEFICDVCDDDNFNDESFDTSIWSAYDVYTTKPGSQVETCGTSTGCPVGPISSANLQVKVPSSTKSGVIHALSDSDLDGVWDDGAPRFGLMTYKTNYEGCMQAGIGTSTLSELIDALHDETAYNGTPTGDALYEAIDYFKQTNSYSNCNNSSYISGIGTSTDPWYEDGSAVECRESFVLLLSDGEWSTGTSDPVRPARISHVSDQRSDLTGTQILSHFTVYSFGYDASGENSMQQTAMFGGFDDYDSNNWPYNRTAYPSSSKTVTLPANPCNPDDQNEDECEEWDADEDGYPDTYYQASEGDVLEASLIDAFSDILQRASSGTAVSILSTTGEGEGAIYQAYFLPEKLEGLESRKWLGYLQALFVDKYGNLREDTNANATLDLTSDYIVEMDYDDNLGSVVNRFIDADGDGEKDSSTADATVGLDDLNAIWKAGDLLWERDATDRTIYTSTSGYAFTDFTDTNAATLQTDLRATDSSEAANIINWVLGDDLSGITDAGHDSGYRERDLTIDELNNVWKLGDIVHSTPTVVGKAVENYDLLYDDISYSEYRTTHMKRRNVVYAGGNDGMLHAFNAGCFDATTHKFYSDVDSTGTCYSDTSEPLGHELWAYIPHNILPHLKWSSMPDYTHVYGVDLKPKVTDIKVFTTDSNHTNGWGTLLIGGLRYGGDDIKWCTINPDVICTTDSQCSAEGAGTCTGGSASSEYFALDVTDPDNPRLLWTFTDAGLGLTMSNPGIAKIGNSWYAIFGSGPTDFDSGSDLTTFQAGTFYVLDLTSGSNGVIDTWTLNTNYWKISTGETNSFIADPINVDIDMDYDTDAIYFGENYLTGSSWSSIMRRITTNKGVSSPGSWVLSSLGNTGTLSGGNDNSMIISAAPSAAMDDRANLYVYFGTGQYYGSSDTNQTDSGGFYALKDVCWSGSCTTEVSSILDVSVSTVDTDGNVAVTGSCGGTVSNWSDLLSASYTCDGWGMFFEDVGESVDFTGAALTHAGERVLGKPLVLGGLVLWTTFIPGSNICENIGESNIYAVYFGTGTSYNDYVFQDQSSGDVARVKRLGSGMPSSISAQITSSGTTKGFVQQSTGSILEIESITPLSLTSDVVGWKNEEID